MVSDEQLLEELREFADEIYETPTARQMDENGPWSKGPYQRAFGSWNEALKEAGLQINEVKKSPDSKEELLNDLREFADEIGETPTAQQMNEDGPWSEMPYKSHFGSWNKALKRAELGTVQQYADSKEQLLQDLSGFADEIGETPSKRQMKIYGPWDGNTYRKHFGSWNEALKQAGLDTILEYPDSKEQLLQDLSGFADEIGETPSINQMEENGPWGKSTYQKYFGSWNKALKEAGLNPVKEYPIEPEWDDDVDNYYGESWPEVRRQTLQRDEYTCQVCGETDSPHVHHITPRRCFEEPDDSNTLDNLITLCVSCHGKCEGRWTELKPTKFAERASELIKKT